MSPASAPDPAGKPGPRRAQAGRHMPDCRFTMDRCGSVALLAGKRSFAHRRTGGKPGRARQTGSGAGRDPAPQGVETKTIKVRSQPRMEAAGPAPAMMPTARPVRVRGTATVLQSRQAYLLMNVRADAAAGFDPDLGVAHPVIAGAGEQILEVDAPFHRMVYIICNANCFS